MTRSSQELDKNGQVVFRYAGANPNGSQNAIAGLSNKEGNVVGLMPLVRNANAAFHQHPEWSRRARGKADPVGLQFFKALPCKTGTNHDQVSPRA